MSGWAADHAIAISPKVDREAHRFYGIPRKKMTVIPGGYVPGHDPVVSKAELQRRFNLPQDGKLILFVGRPDPYKDLESLLDAFTRLRKQQRDLYLILTPLHPGLEQDGVRSIEIPQEDMPSLYRACDAFVCSSVWDGYSLATLEALANGLAVIVSDKAGIAEYCKHGVNALVVQRTSRERFVTDLAQATRSLLASPSLARDLSERAAHDFRPWTWDWVAAQTDQVYQSVRG